MRLVATPIPGESHGIRVWRKLEKGDELPEKKIEYDFACNLLHIDDETCELAQAMGKYTNKTAIAIGMKAIELGYNKMLFCRPEGSGTSRWADYLRTENGLDYYEVDLQKRKQVEG